MRIFAKKINSFHRDDNYRIALIINKEKNKFYYGRLRFVYADGDFDGYITAKHYVRLLQDESFINLIRHKSFNFAPNIFKHFDIFILNDREQKLFDKCKTQSEFLKLCDNLYF